MGKKIGISELKDSLSAVVEEVARGETITVTNRHRPMARIVPYEKDTMETVRILVAAGLARWDGGKPRGLAGRPNTSRAPLSDAVAEDRR